MLQENLERLVSEDNVPRLQFIIERCWEIINIRSYRTVDDSSLLHLAAEANAEKSAEVYKLALVDSRFRVRMQILVDEGIDLEATDDGQRTALHIAAKHNSLDTAKVVCALFGLTNSAVSRF